MKRPTKKDLEQYLGKQVVITLYNDYVLTGELHKTGEEIFKGEPNLYIPREYYVILPIVVSAIFRVSHIKEINLLEETKC